ncbi:MAG: TnpV protein [Lachnospiraceae bacterium]|nr:TnpV protein [Lachnospiraceae bacterium]
MFRNSCFGNGIQRKSESTPQGTEQLKSENALEWVGRMNSIQACTMGIVYAEIIYT